MLPVIGVSSPFCKYAAYLRCRFTKNSPRRTTSTPAGVFCALLASIPPICKRLTESIFCAGVCALVRGGWYCGYAVYRLDIRIIIEAKAGKCKGKKQWVIMEFIIKNLPIRIQAKGGTLMEQLDQNYFERLLSHCAETNYEFIIYNYD